jgi:uncharacterized membrane protein (UPF0182 family)
MWLTLRPDYYHMGYHIPQICKPLDAMPWLYAVISGIPGLFQNPIGAVLLTYHMTDPQVFYNREDQWQVPQEIYGSEQQAVEPYYLIMKLPGSSQKNLSCSFPSRRPNVLT